MIATPFALISAYSTEGELLHALRTIKPSRLFVHASLWEQAVSASSHLGISLDRLHVLEGHVEGKKNFGDMLEYARRCRVPKIQARPANKDTLAYLVFSSGTSGLPKALMISHGNLWFTSMAMVIYTQEEMKTIKVFLGSSCYRSSVKLNYLDRCPQRLRHQWSGLLPSHFITPMACICSASEAFYIRPHM